jgi:hypothetical protein
MTIEELLAREAIRKTIAAYTVAGDSLRTDAFAALFTPDAILETDGVAPEDHFRHEGQAQIRDWMDGWRSRAQSGEGTHQSAFVRHHLSTCHIEMTGQDTARARTYWVAWTESGPDHCGYYLDQFRKSGDVWLIAHRRIREDWRSPQSLFSGAVMRSRQT